MKWHQRQNDLRKGRETVDPDVDWDLTYPELAWEIWLQLEVHGWNFLPHEGGLLEQHEGLWADLSTISYVSDLVRREMDKKSEET